MTGTLAPLQSSRSFPEIEAEILKLRKISASVPDTNEFGFDNQIALQAAIAVLQTFQTLDEVVERYPQDSVHAYTRDSALDAAEWLYNGDVAPSCFWLEEFYRAPCGQPESHNRPVASAPTPSA
jgi:hypothetical protein